MKFIPGEETPRRREDNLLQDLLNNKGRGVSKKKRGTLHVVFISLFK